jgi:hypothetical protein
VRARGRHLVRLTRLAAIVDAGASRGARTLVRDREFVACNTIPKPVKTSETDTTSRAFGRRFRRSVSDAVSESVAARDFIGSDRSKRHDFIGSARD